VLDDSALARLIGPVTKTSYEAGIAQSFEAALRSAQQAAAQAA
jgi:hypothetical protein